ncbi:MAG: hypothetical protein U9N87_05200, partial [Planctomycetota bacterium]|nr:hypothetical protein [Planctomycetota bacterium]
RLTSTVVCDVFMGNTFKIGILDFPGHFRMNPAFSIPSLPDYPFSPPFFIRTPSSFSKEAKQGV